DPQRRRDVHDREYEQVRAVKQAVPQLPADEAEREDRADRDQACEEAIEVLEGGGLDVLGGRTAGSRAFDVHVVGTRLAGRAPAVGVVRTLPGGRGALDRI